MTLTSANPSVLALGETTLSWSSDGTEVSLPVPVTLAAGSTTLTAVASAYYCREGEEALCFIQQTEITLPVTVSSDAIGGELTLHYTLPISSD
jgi:hypothetical protein